MPVPLVYFFIAARKLSHMHSKARHMWSLYINVASNRITCLVFLGSVELSFFKISTSFSAALRIMSLHRMTLMATGLFPCLRSLALTTLEKTPWPHHPGRTLLL